MIAPVHICIFGNHFSNHSLVSRGIRLPAAVGLIFRRLKFSAVNIDVFKYSLFATCNQAMWLAYYDPKVKVEAEEIDSTLTRMKSVYRCHLPLNLTDQRYFSAMIEKAENFEPIKLARLLKQVLLCRSDFESSFEEQ